MRQTEGVATGPRTSSDGPHDPTQVPRFVARDVLVIDRRSARPVSESIVAEEPLEIRVNDASLAVVMRTPGDDLALTAGLLHGEGIVARAADITAIAHCLDQPVESQGNVVLVRLRDGLELDRERTKRHLLSASSCGLCGKATLEMLRTVAPPVQSAITLREETLLGLPAKMRAAQSVFATTGGLHAAALFKQDGELLSLKEDIGRHNAVDKVIGEALRLDALPLVNTVLLVSGRTSFEIMQKARVAQIPIVVAISAPSSLAVDLAHDGQQTLIGFLRDGRYNIYAGSARIARG
jgi:FdhD protein